jgi:hypothetical protein
MLTGPGPTTGIDNPLTQQQFGHTMPGTHQIAAAVLTGTHHIASCFLLRPGYRDFHDLPQMQQTRQMRSITCIGFDPIPRGTLQLRRRSNQAQDPGRGQKPGQPEPSWTRFIGHCHSSGQ